MPIVTRSQAKVQRAESQRAESQRAEAQRAEPQRAEAQRTKPQRAEVQRAKPATKRPPTTLTLPADEDFVCAPSDPYNTKFGEFSYRVTEEGSVIIEEAITMVILFGALKKTCELSPAQTELTPSVASMVNAFADKVRGRFKESRRGSIDPCPPVPLALLQRLVDVGAIDPTDPTTFENALYNMFRCGRYEAARIGIWLLERGLPCRSQTFLVELACPAGYRLVRDFFQQKRVKDAGFRVTWLIHGKPHIDHLKTMITDIYLRDPREWFTVAVAMAIRNYGIEFADWLIDNNLLADIYKRVLPRAGFPKELHNHLMSRGFISTPFGAPPTRYTLGRDDAPPKMYTLGH